MGDIVSSGQGVALDSLVSSAKLHKRNVELETQFAQPMENISATSSLPKWDGNLYQVEGVGGFTSRLHIDDFSVASPDMAKFLGVSSTGPPYGNPDASPATWTVRWNTVNIGLDESDNSLTLTVPGGQQNAPASAAMLRTEWSDILYGSVRTVAKTSNVPGTVNAFYFYHSDMQEADIEIQTSDPNTVHFTNQNTTVEGGDYPTYTSAIESPWASYHEYRLDWIPEKTMFYIDGVLKRTIATSVPSTGSPWLWTCWFNRGRFSQGPPTTDSVLHIASIDMYVNRTRNI